MNSDENRLSVAVRVISFSASYSFMIYFCRLMIALNRDEVSIERPNVPCKSTVWLKIGFT